MAAGQAHVAKSWSVADADFQSPVTASPKTIPVAVSQPQTRIPVPRSRSIVTVSEIAAARSTKNHRRNNPPVERSAQKITTSGPGPSPIFAPAKQLIAAIRWPETVQAAAEFRRSKTSSLAVTPRKPKISCVTPSQPAPRTRYVKVYTKSDLTLSADHPRRTRKRKNTQSTGTRARTIRLCLCNGKDRQEIKG